MIPCHSCALEFDDYKALALHIIASKKGHRKGKIWAAKYMHRNALNAKKQDYGRTPLTEEQKDNKEDSRRILSGDTKPVVVNCPKCRNNHRTVLEEEFAESPEAWKIKGLNAVMCPRCTG